MVAEATTAAVLGRVGTIWNRRGRGQASAMTSRAKWWSSPARRPASAGDSAGARAPGRARRPDRPRARAAGVRARGDRAGGRRAADAGGGRRGRAGARARRERARGPTRADRRVGQQRDVGRARRGRRHDAGGVPPCHRGDVPRLGPRHRVALRRFVPRDEGTIVQVGSALARRGIPLQASYCGAKHALEGFLESLRAELRHRGRRSTSASSSCPASTRRSSTGSARACAATRSRCRRSSSPRSPRARSRTPSSAPREIWVGGPTVLTIVGNRVAPWLVDRYLARDEHEAQQTGEIIPRPARTTCSPRRPAIPARTGCSTTGPRAGALQYELNRRRRRWRRPVRRRPARRRRSRSARRSS